MRLADLPTPLRYLAIALLAFLILAVLHWVDQEDDKPAPHQLGSASDVLASHRVSIHIKRRPGAAPIGAALFTHLPQTASVMTDPRVRWTHLEVEADRAAAIVDQLAHDPAIEQAFIAPVVSLPSEVDHGFPAVG